MDRRYASAVGANKDRARAERAKQDRRAARRKLVAEPAARPAGPTFGDVIAREALLEKASTSTRGIIAKAEIEVVASARRFLRVISCHTCTAPKGCCTLTTTAYLHEAVPLAARLRAEGRDTPELRERLRASARVMETHAMTVSRNSCVFLDENQRCTVYEDRPSVCGTTFVSSPPQHCSEPAQQTESYDHPFTKVSIEAERTFEEAAGLTRMKGPYLGALPRMVLLTLEAWDRPDYVDYLADRTATALRALRAATRGTAV